MADEKDEMYWKKYYKGVEESRENIREVTGHESLIFLREPHFDEAIVGVTLEGQVVYDRDTIIQQLINVDQLTEEDAWDHFDYNVHGTHIQDGPVFINTVPKVQEP